MHTLTLPNGIEIASVVPVHLYRVAVRDNDTFLLLDIPLLPEHRSWLEGANVRGVVDHHDLPEDLFRLLDEKGTEIIVRPRHEALSAATLVEPSLMGVLNANVIVMNRTYDALCCALRAVGLDYYGLVYDAMISDTGYRFYDHMSELGRTLANGIRAWRGDPRGHYDAIRLLFGLRDLIGDELLMRPVTRDELEELSDRDKRFRWLWRKKKSRDAPGAFRQRARRFENTNQPACTKAITDAADLVPGSGIICVDTREQSAYLDQTELYRQAFYAPVREGVRRVLFVWILKGSEQVFVTVLSHSDECDGRKILPPGTINGFLPETFTFPMLEDWDLQRVAEALAELSA